MNNPGKYRSGLNRPIPKLLTARAHIGGLAIRETEEGFRISNSSRSLELPPISLEQLRMFCKFVLEAT